MKIDIFCQDGSPLGVTMKSLYGEDGRIGVGGAEYTLLTMCEEWGKRGYDVTLYNDPRGYDPHAFPFKQRTVASFHPWDDRDILIIFRSPSQIVNVAKGKKVWWSHDQQTTGNFGEFGKCVDQIVCVSKFHVHYFKERYKLEKAIVIDNPVRVADYQQKRQRIPNRFLFSSVPKRGLDIFLNLWPTIRAMFSDASLVITSDYRLWGSPYPLNEEFRTQAMGLGGVKFRGGIKRAQLIEEQLTADVLAYPCIYEELMCIAVAEAEVSGAFPITSTVGALGTTNFGWKVEGDPHTKAWQQKFLETIYSFLKSPDKEQIREKISQKAIKRFNPDNIAKQWDKEVFFV